MRRLDAAGRLPSGSDVARRSIPQEEIAALFEHAQQYLDEFRAEFPAKRALSAKTSYTYRTGQVNAGTGYDMFWSGAKPVPDHKQLDASLRAAFNAERFAASAMLTRATLEELQLIASTKYVGVWLGRRELGQETGHGGGLVVDWHRFSGGGFYLTRPVNVPLLGPVRFESSLAKVRNRLNLNGQENPSKPFFWFARGSFEPIEAFRIGINRAMMFGGEGNLPITFNRLFNNIVGLSYTKDGEFSFASQVLSVDGQLHPNVDWPLQLYLEWGVEDAAGAWWHEPGLLGGVEVGITRDIIIGMERADIAKDEGRNSVWYQNAWFQGSWADDGVLLGHPLGGHGREWRAFVY
ncbi:MAG TPA: capsule assembly Wzi family protein, partial [Longimicrobiales bacterium]|nr:capsule assembly Wzi family protein [Longimicrobiales bacterium]